MAGDIVESERHATGSEVKELHISLEVGRARAEMRLNCRLAPSEAAPIPLKRVQRRLVPELEQAVQEECIASLPGSFKLSPAHDEGRCVRAIGGLDLDVACLVGCIVEQNIVAGAIPKRSDTQSKRWNSSGSPASVNRCCSNPMTHCSLARDQAWDRPRPWLRSLSSWGGAIAAQPRRSWPRSQVPGAQHLLPNYLSLQ